MTYDKNIITAQSILLYPEQDTLAGVMNRLLSGKDVLWEEVLKLKLRPKPRWCTDRIYKWLLKELIYQEIQFGRPIK